MRHLKTFEAFLREGAVGDTEKKVVATVHANEDEMVVKCGDMAKSLPIETTNEEDKTLAERICEVAQEMGATHLHKDDETPKEVAIDEVIGWVMRGRKKGLLKGQSRHKSVWQHINAD